MKHLNDVSTEDILNELERRKKNNDRPRVNNFADFTGLVKTCELVLDDIVKQGYSKDGSHYIYEAAMECIYGKDCWKWINEYNEGC